MPENPSANYFREAMKKLSMCLFAIRQYSISRCSCVTDDSLPIEDATAEWPEAVAPFQNVATITIDKQNFDNSFQVTECEHMAFTPWHGLTTHQPLGGKSTVFALASTTRLRNIARNPEDPCDFPKWPW